MAPTDPASPPQRPPPQPAEATPKARRRVAPEPVEQWTRNGRKQDVSAIVDHAGDPSASGRRFLPQPMETSTKHSKTPVTSYIPQEPHLTTSPQRTLPQPIESSKTSSRARKFAPQLMETARRSRKRTDTLPAVLPSDRIDEYPPGDLLHIPTHLRPSPLPPVKSPAAASTDPVPQLHESRFSSANLAKRDARRHSFRPPDLPRIASSESDEEAKRPSFSTAPSAGSDEPQHYKHATRIRESVDDRSSGYLLALAAKTAEKQLREQVLAAYPNEHDYEPVDHFAVDRDSDLSDTEEGTGTLWRRAYAKAMPHKRVSTKELDMADLRQHRDKMRQQGKDYNGTERVELDSRKPGNGPFMDHAETGLHAKAARGEEKGAEKQEWREMQNAASPPMAGMELQFPQCQSPRHTRLDVGSYPTPAGILNVRPSADEHSGLWTPGGGASRQGSQSGLWMGVCAASVQEALQPPRVLQCGLLTPDVERDNPFLQAQGSSQQLPPSPPSSLESRAGGIDDVTSRERTIEGEFDDTFITQVYNYLSLGYPSLASKFDHELSKITQVPVEQLRRDDSNANAKGYVGAPEGTGSDIRGMQDGQCERWVALRLYVREWARQHPHMLSRNGDANKDWGARARKGSWAI